MPELPEVEERLYGRYFAEHALGQSITAVRVLDERILGDVRSSKLVARLSGRAFQAVRRHGKHLFADAGDSLWLHLHFGMTGDLFYYGDIDAQPRFARVVIDFAGGAHLAYDDMRLFGVVDLVGDPESFIADHRLGPDPLDRRFRLRDFRRLLEARRGAIKPLLMGQEVVAGLGNLYVDEILFQTSIHPRRPVDSLSSDQVEAIFRVMGKILRAVIVRKERGDDYPRGYLIRHREEGAGCPRCGGAIDRMTVFGRTTYFCSMHQRQ